MIWSGVIFFGGEGGGGEEEVHKHMKHIIPVIGILHWTRLWTDLIYIIIILPLNGLLYELFLVEVGGPIGTPDPLSANLVCK